MVALQRPNVVRLAEVVPREDLDDIDLRARLDDGFPAFDVKVLVGEEDPLTKQSL